MKRHFSYLLIGNSRLHWALFKDNKYKFTHTWLNESIKKDFDHSNLIWASVGKNPNFELDANKEVKTKDIDLTNLPSHFGVDRALSCFCAWKTTKNQYNKNLLIADFGTTLSISKINHKGVLIGGELIPGFKTQLDSMVNSTTLLKLPNEITIPKNNFLIETKEAMLKGVYNSLIGVVDLLFNPQEDILIFCGGDSELFGESMKKKDCPIIIKPNLAIEGLILFTSHRLK